MTPLIGLLFSSILLISCCNNAETANTEATKSDSEVTEAVSIEVSNFKPSNISEITLPDDYVRVNYEEHSFGLFFKKSSFRHH